MISTTINTTKNEKRVGVNEKIYGIFIFFNYLCLIIFFKKEEI
jgi:hypothetical protein